MKKLGLCLWILTLSVACARLTRAAAPAADPTSSTSLQDVIEQYRGLLRWAPVEWERIDGAISELRSAEKEFQRALDLERE
ncbi:MAG: hypothetical protein AMXMBFR56_27010 [Polyangiaceae bacterium]